MNIGKRKQKIQTRLGELREAHRGCFVCGSLRGLKVGREGVSIRCRRCRAEGATSPDVEEYEELRVDLARLNG